MPNDKQLRDNLGETFGWWSAHISKQVPRHGTDLDNAWENFMLDIEALINSHTHKLLERVDPFEDVQPCEPDCSPERHAYHQGQWELATKIEQKLNNIKSDNKEGK